MFTTVNEWAILALVFVLGWLLGMLPPRRRMGQWRSELARERAAREAAELRSAEQQKRIVELERHAPAVGLGTAAAVGAAARKGHDDLTLIRGVDRARETRLNESGITRFRDVAALGERDAAALEGRLGISPGTLAQERWREQADMLAHGRHDEHRRTFA